MVMLSAEDDGVCGGKPYRSDAPNGRLSLRARQENGDDKFKVQVIDLASRKSVLEFEPRARLIEAAWCPDSTLVAVEQNKGTHESAVSVFSVDKQKAVSVGLPKDCDEEGAAAFESPTRKHAGKAESLKFHFTSEGLQIARWASPRDLVVAASGMGWWGGDTAGEKDTRFLAEYEITINFAPDGTSSVKKLVLKAYDEI